VSKTFSRFETVDPVRRTCSYCAPVQNFDLHEKKFVHVVVFGRSLENPRWAKQTGEYSAEVSGLVSYGQFVRRASNDA